MVFETWRHRWRLCHSDDTGLIFHSWFRQKLTFIHRTYCVIHLTQVCKWHICQSPAPEYLLPLVPGRKPFISIFQCFSNVIMSWETVRTELQDWKSQHVACRWNVCREKRDMIPLLWGRGSCCLYQLPWRTPGGTVSSLLPSQALLILEHNHDQHEWILPEIEGEWQGNKFLTL